VTVADTGHGISAEQLKRILSPSSRLARKGQGLGLMIVQRIVREHGGLIKLESHEGRGRSSGSGCRWKNGNRVCWRHNGMNSDSKPMVLIVDDEKPTREGLRAALEDRYDVYVAEDAAAAMLLLEQEHFEVLLTDFRLPHEDGMKLIGRAKSLPRPPGLHLDDCLRIGRTGGRGDETGGRRLHRQGAVAD
jgi:hypothetical protein